MTPDFIQPAGSSIRSPLVSAPQVDQGSSAGNEPWRGDLGSGLHDLGNLLQVALASAEEGLEGPAKSEPELARASLVSCRAATRRAVDLLHSLACQLAGREAPHDPPKAVGLSAVVDDVLNMMKPATPAGIRLRLLQNEGDVRAIVDVDLFHRALMNLVRNAIEASEGKPGGIGRSEISVRINADPEGRARVRVSDQGRGMDSETLAKALGGGYSSHGVGRGLGLCFVQNFARAAGGELRLESTPGDGTLAELIFPAPADAHLPKQPRALDLS